MTEQELNLLNQTSRSTSGKEWPEEYFSCQWIEGGLIFGPGYLSICCVPHTSPGKGNVSICAHGGGPLPVDAIISRRNELRVANQLDGDTPCKGCSFLKKKAWGRKPSLFDWITIAHYTICNLNCVYCSMARTSPEERQRTSKRSYDFAPVLKQMIDNNLVAQNATMEWGGGEPTLFGEFEEVVGLALARGMRIILLSNSTVYSDSIKKGLATGQISLCCSVDAGARDTYMRLRGKDLFSTVWDNLATYARTNPHALTVKYIFMDENSSRDEVLSFIKRCIERGIKHLSISRDIGKYRGPSSSTPTDFPADLVDGIALMLAEAIRAGIQYGFWPAFTKGELNDIRKKALRILLQGTYSEHEEAIKKLVMSIEEPEIPQGSPVEKPTFPKRAVLQWHAVVNKYTNPVIFGAGKFTTALLTELRGNLMPLPAVIWDDAPAKALLFDVPVKTTPSIFPPDVDAVIIGTDAFQNSMRLRLKEIKGKTPAIIDLLDAELSQKA